MPNAYEQKLLHALGFKESFLNRVVEECEHYDLLFKGYISEYRYRCIAGSEVAVARCCSQWDENQKALNWWQGEIMGGHSSDTFMQFVVCGPGQQHPDTKSPNPTIANVRPFDKHRIAGDVIPLHLLHSDVLPSVRNADELDVQVSLVAHEARYHEPGPMDDLSARMHSPHGDIHSLYSFLQEHCAEDRRAEVWISGEILGMCNVKETDATVAKVLLLIDTPYGQLQAEHRLDVVREGLRDRIQPGNIVHLTGYLIADCAVNEYQQGAIFDESHLYRYVNNAIHRKQIKRLSSVLHRDCELEVIGGETIVGQEAILQAFRDRCYPENDKNLGSIEYVILTNKPEDCPFINDRALAVASPDGEKYNVLHLIVEGGLIKKFFFTSVDGDYEGNIYTSYERWLNPLLSNITTKDEATKSDQEETKEEDNPRRIGDWDVIPKQHDESLNEVVSTFHHDQEELFNALKPVLQSGCLGAAFKDDPEYGTVVTLSDKGIEEPSKVIAYSFVNDETKSLECRMAVPQLAGEKTVATIEGTYRWEDGIGCEVALDHKDWNHRLTCFVPLAHQAGVKEQLQPGNQVDIALSGVALSLKKSKEVSFEINEGPLYEMELKRFVEADPSKTEADFTAPKVSMKGSVMLFPSEYCSYYTYRFPILDIEEMKYFSTTVYRIKTTLMRNGDEDIGLTLYVAKKLIGDEELSVGDDVEGTFWLQANVSFQNDASLIN